jgi:hypothetical protein
MVDQPVLAADELAQARTDAAHSPAPLTPAISPAGASSAEQPQHHMRRGYAPVAHPFYNVFKNNKNQIPPLPPHAQSSTESNTPSGGGGAFSSLSVETEFSALWAAYPVKKARDRAYRIFRDLKHTGELPAQDRLLSVIAAFRAHDDQWRRGYAPYLNTWLSERRWEDQLLQREKDVETKPVPETLSLSVFKQVRKLPSESEKDNIQALCEAFAAIWPEPVNESLLKGFFISHWGASGGWPSLDMLRRRITEYLAVTEKISLFDGLLYIKKGQGDHVEETASRSGEGRLSGLQGGNRKVA